MIDSKGNCNVIGVILSVGTPGVTWYSSVEVDDAIQTPEGILEQQATAAR